MTTSDQPVASPCVRNCCLNEEDVCLGCFRLLTEIVGWSDADNTERQVILNNTKARRETSHEKYKRYAG
jgi:uncharacterized protein